MVYSRYDPSNTEGDPKDCQAFDIRQLRVVSTEGLIATIRLEVEVRKEYDKAVVKFIVDDWYPIILGIKELEKGEQDYMLEFPSYKTPRGGDWILYSNFYSYRGDVSDRCVVELEVRL